MQNFIKVPRKAGVCSRARRHGIEESFVAWIGVLEQGTQSLFGGPERPLHAAAQIKHDSHRNRRVLFAKGANLLLDSVLGQQERITCQPIDNGPATVNHVDWNQNQRGVGAEGRKLH